MFFEDALRTIRVNGGYMYRIKNPEYHIFIHNETKTLRSNSNELSDDHCLHNDESYNSPVLFSSEIIADDWEVNLTGCWKDQ